MGHKKSSSRSHILFHRTSPKNADSILRGGFKDGIGTYLTDREWSSVWLSDRPLDQHGLDSVATLRVVLQMTDEELSAYEWIEEGKKDYREWLIPASILNSCSRVKRDRSFD